MINGQGFNQYPSPPQPANQRTLDTLNVRLAESIKRAADLRDRARAIADDVFGGTPSTASGTLTFTGQLGGNVSYVGGGAVGIATAVRPRTAVLDDQASDLADILQSLSVEIDRLTCL